MIFLDNILLIRLTYVLNNIFILKFKKIHSNNSIHFNNNFYIDRIFSSIIL